MRIKHVRTFPRLRTRFCVIALACSVCALPATAREITAQEAVSQAQRETDGKVLSVQTLTVGKRKVFRVKVLTKDGQVRVIQIPAES